MLWSTLRRNLGYKILSLVIAIMLYVIAYNQERNPISTREFWVQPTVQNVPQDMVITSDPQSQGRFLKLRGPASVVEELRAAEVQAVVDLSGAGAGTVRRPLQLELPTGVRQKVDITGNLVVDIALEKRKEVEFAVDVLNDSTPPPGYRFLDGVAAPRRVTVSGREADVRRVDRVVAGVKARQTRGAIDEPRVELVAQDMARRVVEGVQIEPQTVRVRVGVQETPDTRIVLLSVNTTGQVAPGYQLVDVGISPRQLTLSGPRKQLEQLSALEVPVDVSGLTQTTVRQVQVSPPPGATLIGSSRVTVRLDVRRIAPDAPADNEPSSPSLSAPPSGSDSRR